MIAEQISLSKKPGEKGNNDLRGAVMVVGGGIAGVQAALDLANTGFFVYLVEHSAAIGGVMAQLDKTFPTNDCSMCILSPKLVECGRHLNIHLLTLADVTALEGEPGHFTVTVRQRPRYIDMDRCIACGVCAEKCPYKAADEFNEGLNQRKAAYVKYPQAVPLKYAIDPDRCIYFKPDKKGKIGRCGACEKFCPAGAVNFLDVDQEQQINVGAIILAPGFKAFDPHLYESYGYGRYKNVITSLEFERILSASGPYEGHLVRPSDHQPPRKIAWLQCVGSRDTRPGAHGYCSGVCCMYAIKEAVIAKEHAGADLETAIFFMDMRTYGKDFERYYQRARNEAGVRFIRSRIHSLTLTDEASQALRLEWVQENGDKASEVFDLVVLSVGLEIGDNLRGLAEKLGVALDADGFVETGSFTPVATSQPGIYVCGAMSGPKDIPYAVMEASAASAASASLLSPARGTLVQEKVYPPEAPVEDQEPRIGVFVCHCGINIAGVVDVPAVREYARTLPHVAYVADNLFTCSEDTQKLIVEAIKENNLNRVVVAACTPRTHEPLFQETIRSAGLNPYLFEFANIRDQDSWVHQQEPERATEKAKDLVRMATAKAALLEPLQPVHLDISQNALVIGGGLAGMTAALNLAEQGLFTYLIEQKDELGGHARKVGHTWKGEDVGAYIHDLSQRLLSHERVEVLTGAELIQVSGFVGNFESTVRSGGSERQLQHGVAILATGAHSLKPSEYLYGQNDRVTRWHDLEKRFIEQPRLLEEAEAVAFIQCVGSREPQRPYCSKICCTSSVAQAIALKKRKPELQVYILYRDLRTYGPREHLYRQARELGVLFIRYHQEEKPAVESTMINGREKLLITVKDHILDHYLKIPVDYLNLATAIIPRGLDTLAKFFKVPLNDDGFFLEAHMKLRPVDFATDGVFVCGLAHYPKPIEESIAQAQAAAARAASVLTRGFVEVEPIVSAVDAYLCIGCGLCEASCPFAAIRLIQVPGKGYRAENITASCKGCGVCAAACPQRAIDMIHFRDRQIMAVIHAGGQQAQAK
ncbi:fumarate reductase/succinate dehydrogenase flavoprotein domain protein [Desulfobacca acetoxidans DSM 11109]|uniref:Fumarate reductase/succinate dehydrogenase flavoprotein domain protein n=2 Tax=Desulfobacca acetoxidans TaxID=60893 RepID=F2NGU3_DESAR|nr:fumarate reductase/succinate dehydrogenase flavoprotein domain protein [Desulfobacca acetoxidans DSM 11109]